MVLTYNLQIRCKLDLDGRTGLQCGYSILSKTLRLPTAMLISNTLLGSVDPACCYSIYAWCNEILCDDLISSSCCWSPLLLIQRVSSWWSVCQQRSLWQTFASRCCCWYSLLVSIEGISNLLYSMILVVLPFPTCVVSPEQAALEQ